MIIYILITVAISVGAVYYISKGILFNYLLFIVFIFNIISDFFSFKISPSSPDIKLTQILLVILVIWFLFYKKESANVRFDKTISFSIIALMIVRFLSVFNSTEPLLSLRYLIITILSWYYFYYITVKMVTNQNRVDQLIQTLVISAFVVALFNYLEFITGANFVQTENFQINERWGITRVYGLLGDPVATAYYLLPILPFGLYLYKKGNGQKWLIMSIVILSALLLNFARITFVSIFIMFTIYAYYSIKRKTTFLIIVFGTLGLILGTNNVISQSLYDTLLSLQGDITSVKTDFDYQRFNTMISMASAMISNVPLFGLGTGALVKQDLMDTYFNTVGYMYIQTSIRTEMPFFMALLLDSGIFASILFIIIYIKGIHTAYNLFKEKFKNKNHISLYILLSLIGYLICLTSNAVFASLGILFLILGLLNIVVNNEKRLSRAK